MNKILNNARKYVIGWTIFTTTFFWTSTMRLFLKPEISRWKIFNFGGQSLTGEVFFLPAIVLLSLFMFYLEGRGRLRYLFYFLISSWHLLITGAAIYGSFQSGSDISFGAWGITLSFFWLTIPLIFFLILTLIWIVSEVLGYIEIKVSDWKQIKFRQLIYVLALLPLAFLLFSWGTGFDIKVKIAIVITIVQWILLADSLGRPEPEANRD